MAEAHDVNSNTNRSLLNRHYAVFRQWDTAPQIQTIGTPASGGTGAYSFDVIANGNDIQVKFTHNAGSTVTRHKIIAKWFTAP